MVDEVLISECPKCGAGLDVLPDSVRLRCHQCSLAVQVQRSAGTVVLISVPEIVTVSEPTRQPTRWAAQFTTQSTTAEIEAGLEELRRNEVVLLRTLARKKIPYVAADVLIIIAVIAYAIWRLHDKNRATQITMGMIFLAIIIFPIPLKRVGGVWVWIPRSHYKRFKNPPELEELQADMQRLDGLLAEKARQGPSPAKGSHPQH